MRTVSTDLGNAITENESARMLVKAIIDPSRTFFKTLTANNPYDAGDYDVPTDTPTGQCMLYYNDKAYTFIVDPTSGVIYGMEQGSGTTHNLGITTDEETKPGCASLGNGTAYLWYWNSPNITRVTVNLSTWGVSGSTNIAPPAHANWTVSTGSINAISSTQFAFCYKTSKGGMGVDYYDGSSWHSWDKRFMSPKTLTATRWTIHTAAAILGSNVFIYSTDMDSGEVRGVEYRPYNEVWTDSFVALPSDLSRFCIGNAIGANGFIHLAGQFHRTEDLAAAKVHSLALRSLDGRVFSWDRFTMLSTLGFQFQIAQDTVNLKIYASDRNCVGVANMSYFFCSVPPDRVILQPPSDIISFAMSGMGGATLKISSYDERYMFHAVIKKGSRVIIYLGYETAAVTSPEYVEYQTYIISARQQGFAAGKRNITLGLEDEGTWKVNQIAFPFYSELLSKSSILDDCDENDRMYPVATKSPMVADLLILDFWDNEEWDGDGGISGTPRFWGNKNNRTPDPYSWTDADAERYLFRTASLNGMPQITEYPTIQAGQTVQAKLYGWERGGSPSRVNSTWTLYIVTAPEDDLDNKTATGGTKTSTYQWFPRDYPSADSGSYPIIFEWTGLTAGHKVLYFGVSVYNNATGQSMACPERIEITGLDFAYSSADSAKVWKAANPDSDTYSRSYLKMPETALPAINFTTKPYTAFMFNVAAEFIYYTGASPLGPGTTGWGCIGIAKDGKNCIIGRYKRQNSYLEIVKLRNGVETVVASASPGGGDLKSIMLEHRDGLLSLWYKSSTTWIGPSITYHWDEITQGVMSTSLTGIMHTGIYGGVVPPGFYATAFSTADAKGICMIPGFPTSSLVDFPGVGTIVIQGKKYNYAGKSNTNNNWYGPYQGRQTGDYGTYREGGQTYEGEAAEIALYKPNNSRTLLDGLLFSTDNGHTWLMEKTDWTVTHYNAGTPNHLRNRSRHYAEDVNGDHVGPRYRCYIGQGLTEMEKAESGDTPIHPNWCYAALSSTDRLYAKKVTATQVDQDATVEDMIRYLCRTASVDTEFPGNWVDDSVAISGTPVLLASGVKQFPGGWDMHFEIPALSSGQWIAVYASNLLLKNPANETQSEAIDLGIRNNGGVMEVYSDPKTGYNDPEYIQISLDPSKAHVMRVLFHEEFASLYADGVWLATFAYGKDNLIWPTNDEQLYLYAYASTSKTLSNVSLSELFDWREAIYVESELSAKSALGSVIQERPVEMAPTPLGDLQFSYNITRDQVTYTSTQAKKLFFTHARSDGTSGDAGSDAVVYFLDITFASSQAFAEEEGFLTRVYKLSGLNTGAGVAASILLEKAYERQFAHSLTMRPDPRVEVGDRISFTYIVPGTAREVTYNIIVEDIGISIEEGNYIMNVRGREDV